jgi:hypothetical protein
VTIAKETQIIGTGTARVATQPNRSDEIVTLSLYGDIICDLTAELAGSVGMAGSEVVKTESLCHFDGLRGFSLGPGEWRSGERQDSAERVWFSGLFRGPEVIRMRDGVAEHENPAVIGVLVVVAGRGVEWDRVKIAVVPGNARQLGTPKRAFRARSAAWERGERLAEEREIAAASDGDQRVLRVSPVVARGVQEVLGEAAVLDLALEPRGFEDVALGDGERVIANTAGEVPDETIRFFDPRACGERERRALAHVPPRRLDAAFDRSRGSL